MLDLKEIDLFKVLCYNSDTFVLGGFNMEKKIVTREEAIERVKENREVINTAYGRVNVSKTFFKICGAVGVVAAGIGVAGIATLGFVLVPVATTGLGVATAVTSGIFHRGETKEGHRLEEAWEENRAIANRIVEKQKVKSK